MKKQIVFIVTVLTSLSVSSQIQTDEEIAYNKEHKIKKMVQFTTRANTMANADTTLVKEFNDRGQVTRIANYYYGRVNSEQLFEYNNGLLTLSSNLYGGTVNAKTQYEYDKRNRLVKETWLRPNGGSSGWRITEYNKNGLKESTQQFNASGHRNYSEHYRYDKDGNKVYRATTTYSGDTNFREISIWKNGLLIEMEYKYPYQYSNSKTVYTYDSKGRKIKEVVTAQNISTTIEYAYDEDGNEIRRTTSNVYPQSSYNNMFTMLRTSYKNDLMSEQIHFSNQQHLRRNIQYSWRGDDLIEIREMAGGTYVRSQKFESFPSARIDLMYEFDYQTGSIKYVEESKKNKKGQIISVAKFKPDYKLTNIFDLRRPKEYAQDNYAYQDDWVVVSSTLPGWDSLENVWGSAKQPYKNAEKEEFGSQTILTVKLPWGGTRKAYRNLAGEFDSVVDYSKSGERIYCFTTRNGRKVTTFKAKSWRLNQNDSVVERYALEGGFRSPAWNKTYEASFDENEKIQSSKFLGGKLLEECRFKHHKDSVTEIITSPADRKERRIVWIYEEGKVKKSKESRGDGLPPDEWLYTYTPDGKLINKSQTSLSETQRDTFIYQTYR